MSGGVDSSVALRLLQEEGHDDLTAFYLKIWLEDELHYLGDCPWEEDLAYARAVCDAAGVPLEVVPLQRQYWDRVVSYTIAELKERFSEHTYQLQVECGGNGRSEYVPAASGNQWTTGAVACPTFTGVRLRDVLEACGIADDAVYIGYYGADRHASGAADKEAISRGVPMEKALEDESLIAWAMNGEDIPYQNGYPLRLVCGG